MFLLPLLLVITADDDADEADNGSPESTRPSSKQGSAWGGVKSTAVPMINEGMIISLVI